MIAVDIMNESLLQPLTLAIGNIPGCEAGKQRSSSLVLSLKPGVLAGWAGLRTGRQVSPPQPPRPRASFKEALTVWVMQVWAPP